MNEIANKCLLVGDIFMPEMHFSTTCTYLQCLGTFTKNNEYKNLKKQEIENIFIKMSQIKLAFNMARFMDILNIYLEKQLLIKYCIIKQLILLNIQNMTDINAKLLQ